MSDEGRFFLEKMGSIKADSEGKRLEHQVPLGFTTFVSVGKRASLYCCFGGRRGSKSLYVGFEIHISKSSWATAFASTCFPCCSLLR